MARTRSAHTHKTKTDLVSLIQNGFHRPGETFMSTRTVAARYNISYQTAHRLLNELVREGILNRKPASRTYLPGIRTTFQKLHLIFNPRARRKGSFGEYLFQQLTQRLDHEKIPWIANFTFKNIPIKQNHFPILWEQPALLNQCTTSQRSALLLFDAPRPGMNSLFIDSISFDDFSGGVYAGQMLQQKTNSRTGFAVFAGPTDDPRGNNRIDGFKSIVDASVVHAKGWDVKDGREVVATVFKQKPKGVFCCNDRMAQAVFEYYDKNNKPRPLTIGFGDAPIAESLNLTTIGFPWKELFDGTILIIKRRFRGDITTASHQTFTPRPVFRGWF